MQVRQFIIATAVGRGIMVLLVGLLGFIAWNQIRGNAPTSAVVFPLLIMAFLMAIIAGMHVSIRVDTHLQVRFWPFPPRNVSFADIAAVEVAKYRPIREFGGWGLRWNRQGTAYTTSGSIGVRVDLKNGRYLMLSAKHPAAVRDEIRSHLHG